ncbi:MAG: ArnT family glycosyltransferase [Candidatus Nealsonbacteria bacterium]
MLSNLILFLKSKEIYSAFPGIIAVISLLALFLAWNQRKVFIKLFGNISKVTLLILILIAIAFVLVCAFWGLNFKFFNACDREWRELSVASNLLSGNESALSQFPEKKVPSLMLALGFRIFGFNPLIASLMNLFLAVLSIFLVFVLAQVVFKNEKVSLASSLLYAFNPFTLVFTSLRMGDSTTVGFFLLLFAITAILSFRYHKLSLHILTLAFFALTVHTKPEYFILIFPLIFCFIIFKEYIYFSPKKIIILIILFFLFSLPFFVSNIHFRESYALGWCGTPSQTFHNGKIYSYSQPITEPLDKIIRFLTNGRFSINYLIYDIPNFIKFWSSKGFVLTFSLILFGSLSAFKKHKKESLFIFSLFLSISTVYLADCIYYETRLAIPTFGPIVIFSGLAVSLLSEKIKKGLGIRLPEMLIGGGVILALIFCCYFDFHHLRLLSYKNYSTRGIVNSYNDFKDIIDYYHLSPDDSHFVAVHETEMEILRFLGYETHSFTDLIRTDYFQDRQKFFQSLNLSLNPAKNNYFIYSWYCKTQIELTDVCNFVKDNYTEKEIGQRNGYRIYLLKD